MRDVWVASFGIKTEGEEEKNKEGREVEMVKWMFNM